MGYGCKCLVWMHKAPDSGSCALRCITNALRAEDLEDRVNIVLILWGYSANVSLRQVWIYVLPPRACARTGSRDGPGGRRTVSERSPDSGGGRCPRSVNVRTLGVWLGRVECERFIRRPYGSEFGDYSLGS